MLFKKENRKKVILIYKILSVLIVISMVAFLIIPYLDLR